MIARLLTLCLAACLWQQPAALAQEAPDPVTEQEWTAYKERFLARDGRVIDDANGGISHSEGQGYGMLLAFLARSRADFERIWSFTRTELMLRDDGLAAWKWDPDATPHVIDPNNASDGDLLIAYALALAGRHWEQADYLRSAAELAAALARTSMFEHGGRTLLKPGVDGFGEDARPDGPVVNLSYWVFEALPVMEELAPEGDWSGLAQGGLELIREAAFGERRVPPDWLALRDEPKPAEGFPAEFGYNALRIPLYLIRAGEDDRELLRRMRDGMAGEGGALVLTDLDTEEPTAELTDRGYRIIPALASCIVDEASLPDELTHFEPTLYYPSTLHLLALAHIREDRPQCL